MNPQEQNDSPKTSRIKSFIFEKHFYGSLILIAIVGVTGVYLIPVLIGVTHDGMFRQNLLWTAGGAIGLLTLGASYYKTETDKKLAEDKLQQDKESAEAKLQQDKESAEAKLQQDIIEARRKRYADAVEQIASDKAAVRLGGINTLFALADDWSRWARASDDLNKIQEFIPETSKNAENIKEFLEEKQNWIPDREIDARNEVQSIINTICSYIISPYMELDTNGNPMVSTTERNILKRINTEISKTERAAIWHRDIIFDFSEAIFSYDIDLSNIEFYRPVDFSSAKFNEGLNFRRIQFHGISNFSRAKFHGRSDFSRAEFHGNSDFWWAKFHGRSDFSRAEFHGNSDFGWAEFHGNSDFGWAEFQGSSNFSRAEFQGSSNFSWAKFQGNSNFSQAEFQGNSSFSWAKFQGNSSFSGAKFQGDSSFIGAKFQGDSSFRWAEFHDASKFAKAQFIQKTEFANSFFNTTFGKTGLPSSNSNIVYDGAIFRGTELGNLPQGALEISDTHAKLLDTGKYNIHDFSITSNDYYNNSDRFKEFMKTMKFDKWLEDIRNP